MSPEQARGEELDARTDMFSFGAVLYEMATGRQAFRGNTAAVIHEAILNRQPGPVTGINPKAPAKLEEIIGKALEKDRDLRYHSAGDLRGDLKRLKRELDSGRSTAPGPGQPLARATGVSGELRRSRTRKRSSLITLVGGLALIAVAREAG